MIMTGTGRSGAAMTKRLPLREVPPTVAETAAIAANHCGCAAASWYGGMLSYQLAAAHPQWFAAIAAVSATVGGTSRNGNRFVIAAPDRPVPVMIIHGRKDPFV